MKYFDIEKKDHVYVVSMTNGDDQNRVTDEVLQEHHDVLDQLEKEPDDAAVVLTSPHEKFWSNGIHLEWLMQQDPAIIPEFKLAIDRVLLRWALLDRPTIACITGHAFGAGAILAATFDFRTMRSDRGYFCFPEVDVNIPFTPLMQEVIQDLVSPDKLRELALTGKRVGGEEAKQIGLVHECATMDNLMDVTLEMATVLGQKNRATYGAIKHGLKRRLVDFEAAFQSMGS